MLPISPAACIPHTLKLLTLTPIADVEDAVPAAGRAAAPPGRRGKAPKSKAYAGIAKAEQGSQGKDEHTRVRCWLLLPGCLAHVHLCAWKCLCCRPPPHPVPYASSPDAASKRGRGKGSAAKPTATAAPAAAPAAGDKGGCYWHTHPLTLDHH